jgi:hypothetical protein
MSQPGWNAHRSQRFIADANVRVIARRLIDERAGVAPSRWNREFGDGAARAAGGKTETIVVAIQNAKPITNVG